jgi:hypothetical protein
MTGYFERLWKEAIAMSNTPKKPEIEKVPADVKEERCLDHIFENEESEQRWIDENRARLNEKRVTSTVKRAA